MAKNRGKRLEGVLWVHRTDPPVARRFGRWESVESRFLCWSECGLWAHIGGGALREWPGEDHEVLTLKSISVKANRHNATARGWGEDAIGRSRGGRGTKVDAVCNALPTCRPPAA